LKVVLASNNRHKALEFKQIFESNSINLQLMLPSDVYLSGLDVDETGTTFHENSFIKAKEFYLAAGMPAIADDSGLEVDFLDKSPGIYSARYSGPNATDEMNRKKLLSELINVPPDKRSARFRCVICYYDGDISIYGDGSVEGEIIFEERGSEGFGYDSIFVPKGYDKTFAEISSELKNNISHRRNALMDFMNNYRGLAI